MFESFNESSQQMAKNNNLANKDSSHTSPPISKLSKSKSALSLNSSLIQNFENLNIGTSDNRKSNNNSGSNTPTNQGSDKSRKVKQRWNNNQQLKNNNINSTNIHNSNCPPSPGITSSNPVDYKKHPTYQKIEDINNKLRSGLIILPNEQRSPSPEPLFNSDGKQVNTREIRHRKKLEEEKQKLIEQAQKLDPNFKPPNDSKKVIKLQEKYFIPVHLHPDINFIGLLIGPRGNTLKRMELDSGAKISIRGKGSVKEGKRFDSSIVPGNDEELHCLITADTSSKIKKAKRLIERIIETSASVPEGQNELKRQQLRELAALNGTLRDDENQVCGCCGMKGHKKSDCPDVNNPAHNIICYSCIENGLSILECNHPIPYDHLKTHLQYDRQINQNILQLVDENDIAINNNTLANNHPTSAFRKNSIGLSIQYPHPALEANIPSWKLNGHNPIPSPGIPFNNNTSNNFKISSPGLPFIQSNTNSIESFPNTFNSNGQQQQHQHDISNIESFPTIFNKSTNKNQQQDISNWVNNVENSIINLTEQRNINVNPPLGIKFYPNQIVSPGIPSPQPFTNLNHQPPPFIPSDTFKISLSSGSNSPLSLQPQLNGHEPGNEPENEPTLPWVCLSGPNAGEESKIPQ